MFVSSFVKIHWFDLIICKEKQAILLFQFFDALNIFANDILTSFIFQTTTGWAMSKKVNRKENEKRKCVENLEDESVSNRKLKPMSALDLQALDHPEESKNTMILMVGNIVSKTSFDDVLSGKTVQMKFECISDRNRFAKESMRKGSELFKLFEPVIKTRPVPGSTVKMFGYKSSSTEVSICNWQEICQAERDAFCLEFRLAALRNQPL